MDAELVGVEGKDRLEGLVIKTTSTGKTRTAPASGVFIFIGAVPHTDLVAGLVERNTAEFILTGPDLMRDGRRPKGWTLDRDPYLLETNVPGIFAVGDVRQGVVRRVASAVGEGAMAVTFVHQHLATV